MVRLLATLVLLGAQAGSAQTHLLVISGSGGDPQYSNQFHEWSVTMLDAATDRFGLDTAHVTYLAERADRDPSRIAGKSSKENVHQHLTRMAAGAAPDDIIFILLIGHGSARDGESRFNIPGPDITASEFAVLLEGFDTQRIVFVNLATASGDFVKALSAANRTVVTATKTGFERNESVFGGFFVQAFAEDGADVDKDDNVSVLEAFNFANREVERAYKAENRLRTEHALLDDNGDGEGSMEPDGDGEGALARATFLGRGQQTVVGAANTDPVLARLYREKQDLDRRLALLRQRKDQMAPSAYETALEDLLLMIAEKGQQIREQEAKR